MDRRKRILIVDDEPNVRLMFRTALSTLGAEIALAEDGEQALDRLERSSFDLVLLDLKMPHLGGMETLRRLRDRDDDTPVVTLREGGTPLLPAPRLSERVGAEVHLAEPTETSGLKSKKKRAKTDWADARDVPREAGPLSLDDYVRALESFIGTARAFGSPVHVIAICQASVPALGAAALLATDEAAALSFRPAIPRRHHLEQSRSCRRHRRGRRLAARLAADDGGGAAAPLRRPRQARGFGGCSAQLHGAHRRRGRR